MQTVNQVCQRNLNTKQNINHTRYNRVNFSGFPKCELPNLMEKIEGQIRNVTLRIAFGDMTKVKTDAYIVPHFNDGASYQGVGGAVARAGALKGIDEYRNLIIKKGQLNFGTVLLSDSHGGNSNKLLHVASVNSAPEQEFAVVNTSIYNALRTAEENGVKSVASPALGTGIIGNLTPEQSAKSILSAVKQFADEGRNIDFSIVIYGDKGAYNDFVKTLSTKSYEKSTAEVGKKEFDLYKFKKTLSSDNAANKAAGLNPFNH